MSASTDERAFQENMAQIETLLKEVQESADPQVYARTKRIVQGLMDLHGAALERILAMIGDATVVGRLARDDLVGSVLLLYGLHPLDLETRVQQGLNQARTMLRSHGSDVELISVQDGVVHVQLIVGNQNGGCSTGATLKSAVEDAIYSKAPDVAAVEVEEIMDALPATDARAARLALPLVR